MTDATITLQKTSLDRASAWRAVTGRSAWCPPRMAVAVARLSIAATTSPTIASQTSATYQPDRSPLMRSVTFGWVRWREATRSHQLASANGPTVPRTMMPM